MQILRKRSPRGAATSAFTLAEVAVTIVIIGVGLVFVRQSLSTTKLEAAHNGGEIREIAPLTRGERQPEGKVFGEAKLEELTEVEVEQPYERVSAQVTPPLIQDGGDFYTLHFPEATTRRCCESESNMSLYGFVRACQEATGITFTYERDTKAHLLSNRLLMFGTKRIPKEDFYSFFQIMMIINDLVCTKTGSDHSPAIRIEVLQRTGARSGLRQKGIYLKPGELDCCADKPTTLVTTVLRLPNTDVQTLSLDSDRLEIVPVASSNAVILTGFGSDVAALGRKLLSADKAAEAYKSVEPVPTEGN